MDTYYNTFEVPHAGRNSAKPLLLLPPLVGIQIADCEPQVAKHRCE